MGGNYRANDGTQLYNSGNNGRAYSLYKNASTGGITS